MNISSFGISEKFIYWKLIFEEKRQKCNYLSVTHAIYILKTDNLLFWIVMPRLSKGYYSPRVAFPDYVTSLPGHLFRLGFFLRHRNVLLRGFVPLERSSWTYSSLLERNVFYLSNQLSQGIKMIHRYFRGNADAFA